MMQGMIAVIVAGGAGTRLWPLSTPEYPKHLLKVVGEKSLLQAAYERARALAEHIYVITEVSHAHHVRDQLPELPDEAFIIEPARRGTSGCALAAIHFVQSRHGHDEAMAVLWADHHIRDINGFVQSFKIAGKASEKHGRVVLVGIEPTYASTGLGYIHKAGPLENGALIYDVAGFKEKPALDLATQFFQSGEYLWNGGYVVGTVNAFVEAMRTYCPQLWKNYQSLLATTSPEQYEQAYLALEDIALDYTFNELVKNLLVVPASFDWLDLGSFKDMYEAVDHDNQGNHTKGSVELEEVENSFVQNHEDKPVAVIGLDNIVVVNTPSGILVARKDLSQKVKEVSKRFKK
jgi:mannose-1-phosphate guanylyltransferase/mannose-6-phosphate isomerase